MLSPIGIFQFLPALYELRLAFGMLREAFTISTLNLPISLFELRETTEGDKFHLIGPNHLTIQVFSGQS
jgi:hypothetical protein